ncbi:MAG: YkvA family protein [Anaerolineae bacterium]|nr:YkvA family protein [Anaerolineae bacterium]
MIAALRRRADELKRETYALYLAYRDPRTPWLARIVAGCVVAYAFSPLDLVPDFVPVLGYLDDLVLVPLGVALALRLIPPEVLAESRARARAIADRPSNRAAAAIIVVVWIGVAALVAALVIRALRGG